MSTNSSSSSTTIHSFDYGNLRFTALLARIGWISNPSSSFPFYSQEGVSNGGIFPYFEIAFLLSFFIFLFEKYLSYRQKRNYKKVKKSDDVPAEVKAIDTNNEISMDKFQSSVAYGLDKINFGMSEESFSFCIGWIYCALGFYPYIWDISASIVANYLPDRSEIWAEMYATYVFVVLTSLWSTVCDMPFRMYSTFVIEAKHGFNNSTLTLFFKDTLKSTALTVIFSPLVMGFVWVVRSTGEHFYFYVWLFTLFITLLTYTIVPIFIMPLFNRFLPFEESKYTALKASIDAMAADLKFPLTKIFVVDGSIRSAHSNAYLFGFFNNKRIVLYDTLLEADEKNNIRKTSDDEILAILGHEMGHWKLSHTLESFFNSQVYLFLTFYLFSKLQNAQGLYESFGFRNETCPVIIALMLFGATFGKLINQLMEHYITYRTRCNEFAADAFAVNLGKGEGLKSGLIKLNVNNLGNMVPDPYYAMYHFTHPALVERITAINAKMALVGKKTK